jgi:hypothetical protein
MMVPHINLHFHAGLPEGHAVSHRQYLLMQKG